MESNTNNLKGYDNQLSYLQKCFSIIFQKNHLRLISFAKKNNKFIFWNKSLFINAKIACLFSLTGSKITHLLSDSQKKKNALFIDLVIHGDKMNHDILSKLLNFLMNDDLMIFGD